jgi:Putative Actinobacterial Holin-X, holin superfamily III
MAQEPDWATQAVDMLESVVSSIRSKTSEPATRLVKYLVFGVMAIGVLVMLFLFLTIAAVRGLDAALPQSVWLTYFILSAVFMLVGALLWSRRKA